jgi:hypothetical protein
MSPLSLLPPGDGRSEVVVPLSLRERAGVREESSKNSSILP